jgi:hypothetical protein
VLKYETIASFSLIDASSIELAFELACSANERLTVLFVVVVQAVVVAVANK